MYLLYTKGNIYIAPVTGWYDVQLWGASGGGAYSMSAGEHAGRGAYVSGELYLLSGTTCFINVGGKGDYKRGGYNGGGSSENGSGGGGATDIRITANQLPYRIAVAAGGGGSDDVNNENDGYGGHAGGLIGDNGGGPRRGIGGTQKSGNALGSGGSGTYLDAGGGGGGYYGGTAGGDHDSGGGGGSSYISGYSGCTDNLTGFKFQNSQMINGKTRMPLPNGTFNTGNWGNGHARITLKHIK